MTEGRTRYGERTLIIGVAVTVLFLAMAFCLIPHPDSFYPNFLLTNGSRSLTANWYAGNFNITASWFRGNFELFPSLTKIGNYYIDSTFLSANNTVALGGGSPTWGSITGKPDTFPPSIHSHSLSSANVSDWGQYFDQSVLTSSSPTFVNVTASWFKGNFEISLSMMKIGNYYINGNFLSANNTVAIGAPTAWGDVTDKPLTFPPEIHSHTLSASNISSGVFATARIPTLSLSSLNISNWGTAMTWTLVQDKPATFTPSSHGHTLSASNITSGVFSTTRIPTLTLSTLNITSGTFGTSYIPSLPASQITSGQFSISRIPTLTLSTSNITSGTFGTSYIPSLPASQITSGQFSASRIPTLTLSASNITSGTFGTSYIPSLPASQITSGQFSTGRIPTLTLAASNITSGTFALSYIPTMDDTHIPNIETLSYSSAFNIAQIPNLWANRTTIGTFDLARIPTMDDAHIPNLETLSYGSTFAQAQIPSFTLAEWNVKMSDVDLVAFAGQIGGTSASPDIRGLRETGGQLLTMGAVADTQYLMRSGNTIIGGTPGGGSPPAWKGYIAGAYGDGNPAVVLEAMECNGVISPTPTNIGITIARISYFKLDTALTVNKIRFYGVGAVTTIYHVAIYRDSDSVRITNDYEFTTVANTWGSITVSPAVTLDANVLYFIAVSVDTTGTTPGILAMSPTVTAIAGQIAVLPTSWPGNLDINAASPKIAPTGFAQFTVTAGALPATASARAAQGLWTGGFPAFFLDNSAA